MDGMGRMGRGEEREAAALEGGPEEMDGVEALDEAIGGLRRRLAQVQGYIDARVEEVAPIDYARLVGVETELAACLGRLIRDRVEVAEQQAGSVMQMALDEALDRLSEEWGIEL